MDENEVKNTKENSEKSQSNSSQPNGKVLRCINIDCVFNSSNKVGAIRNTCNHPNVVVESRFADITIAICSEFRSKKDYSFERPATLIDLKTREKTEIVGIPAIGDTTTIETVTTKDLEKEAGYTHTEETKTENVSQETPTTEDTSVKPVVIESGAVNEEELTPSQIYNLTDKPGTDFLILKKLYQPYTKRGLIGSIIFHLFIILLMWQFLISKEETVTDPGHNQRIVVVEDLEMPKFNPPDIDKLKEEEEAKLKEEEVKDNTQTVRPKINTKRITPNIKRPNNNIDTPPDTNKLATNDTNRTKNDSNLTKNPRDTSRITVPDSLKANYDQNDVGLKLWYPVGWKLMDSRQINLTQKEFNGVIIATDSLSEDPGAVNMFVIIDDPQHSVYNKATYKNSFPMDDSVIVAYVTDPQKGSGKKMSTKYYLFTDPTGIKNIQVNVEFASQAIMEKYQKMVDAVVRSIKIAPPQNPNP